MISVISVILDYTFIVLASETAAQLGAMNHGDNNCFPF